MQCQRYLCRAYAQEKEDLSENSAAPGFWLLAPLSLPTQRINQAILRDKSQALLPDFSTLDVSVVYVSIAWRKKIKYSWLFLSFVCLPCKMTLRNGN